MNVSIRRTEPDDYLALCRVFAGREVVRGTLQLPYPSTEAWRKRLAEPGDGLFSLVADAEGEVVGQIGVHTFPNSPRRRHVGQIFMAVRDDCQREGVGSALMHAAVDLADNWLNLGRLELEVFTDNERAVRLYQRHGFGIEGTLVRYAFRDGQYVDVYAMARLRP